MIVIKQMKNAEADDRHHRMKKKHLKPNIQLSTPQSGQGGEGWEAGLAKNAYPPKSAEIRP